MCNIGTTFENLHVPSTPPSRVQTQLSDADHAAQGAHDATDLLVETLKLHNNRLASEVQAYRGRCQSLERALQEIHLNAPSAETPAPNGQRKDLGRCAGSTRARRPRAGRGETVSLLRSG